MSTRPIPTPFDAPLPGEAGTQPAQAQSQVATPFDVPLPGEVAPPEPPMQKPKSYLNFALGIDPTSPQSPSNPMQPGEQWAIQNPGPALGAAGIGAVGAAGATLPAAVNAGASGLIPYAPQIVKAAKAARDAGMTLAALKYLSKGDVLGFIKKSPGK